MHTLRSAIDAIPSSEMLRIRAPLDEVPTAMVMALQQRGQTPVILIEPEADGKHWQSIGYQFDQPTTGKFIRGTVEGNGLVRFGIEQYFVQEGQGHDYENAVREKKLSAEVILDSSGYAQIKRLIIE